VRDLECLCASVEQEGEKDGMLRVRVDTCAGLAEGEGVPEEGGAGGFFQALNVSNLRVGEHASSRERMRGERKRVGA
jgi:hypothetical protein